MDFEALGHATIELAAFIWGRGQDGALTPLVARQHAREIARRDALNDEAARRLLAVADALTAPLAAEDE